MFPSILLGTGNEGRNSRSISGSKPVVNSRILDLLSCVSLHNTEPVGDRWVHLFQMGKTIFVQKLAGLN